MVRRALVVAWALVCLLGPATAESAVPLQPSSPSEPSAAPAARQPRAFLIYLIDGRDPIIVKRYVEEKDQIRFEKYGGVVGIPKYEILKIIPDQPDTTVNLPPAPDPAAEAGKSPPGRGADLLRVSMRNGTTVRATGVRAEGDRVQVSLAEGSFTVPRSDLVGVMRVSAETGIPEAWLSILSASGAEPANGAEPLEPPPGFMGSPSWLLSLSSGRPHLVRLANGQVLRAEGFWVEKGELRFRRLGGIVGLALSEVARLMPEEPASPRGRTPVRFARQLGPDLLEVRAPSGVQRVRLIGLEPVAGTRAAENPWGALRRGLVVYVEFDRQRYDPRGDWLAYVFLPNGRMLNAELIRLGLARPRTDPHNLRYLDLFHEVAPVEPPSPAAATPFGN